MIYIIERAGRPIGALLIGDKPKAFFADDAFSDLKSEQPTDQAPASGESH